jgi:hypothetical protein
MIPQRVTCIILAEYPAYCTLKPTLLAWPILALKPVTYLCRNLIWTKCGGASVGERPCELNTVPFHDSVQITSELSILLLSASY